jgi:hypothetical protein
MPRERAPRPTDLLTADDIADIYGWPLSRAQNVLRKIARARGGPVRVIGVRRVFIERRDLEAAVQGTKGTSS